MPLLADEIEAAKTSASKMKKKSQQRSATMLDAANRPHGKKQMPTPGNADSR